MDAESFGERLRALRLAAGFSQERLAERAGLSANAVGQLERGERTRPYPHTVAALAAALGLDADGQAALALAARGRAPASPAPRQTWAIPQPPAPIIGRDDDLRRLVGVLTAGSGRLVTLTGPGGVGKTRLALAVAAAPEVAAGFPDGAAFVGLAGVQDAALVPGAVADGLGIRLGGQPVGDAVRDRLRDRRVLLLLDNLEHLPAAAPEIADLLADCPRLVVLATSRAPLRLRGEREHPVAPLALPALGPRPAAADALASPAVRMFVEHAAAIDPAFALSDANAAAVVAICRRLDGLPLAIELAAAWTRTLSPAALLARLDKALPLLAGGPRDLPERQRTMRDAVAWSEALLDAPARRLFRRLAVFSGGFDLAAAEAIAGDLGAAPGNPADSAPSPDRAAAILSDLDRLIDHALVLVDRAADSGGRRYRLLEPVREYALERLETAGEAEAVRERHAAAMSLLAATAAPELWGANQIAWLDRLDDDLDNLRAALGWLVAEGRRAEAAGMAWSLWLFWWWRGRQAEGAGWAERILAGDEADPLPAPNGSRLRVVLAAMRYRLGGPEQPAALYAEALAFLHQRGSDSDVAHASLGLGVCQIRLGQVARGEALIAEAVERFQRAGEDAPAAYALTSLGVVPYNRGDFATALTRFEDGLALARQSASPLVTLFALYDVALAAHALDDLPRAGRLYREGLAAAVELGEPLYVAYFLEGLAALAGSQHRPRRAARLAGAARARLDRLAIPPDARGSDPRYLVACLDRARALAHPDAWDADWADGAAQPDDAIVADGLAEEAMAGS